MVTGSPGTYVTLKGHIRSSDLHVRTRRTLREPSFLHGGGSTKRSKKPENGRKRRRPKRKNIGAFSTPFSVHESRKQIVFYNRCELVSAGRNVFTWNVHKWSGSTVNLGESYSATHAPRITRLKARYVRARWRMSEELIRPAYSPKSAHGYLLRHRNSPPADLNEAPNAVRAAAAPRARRTAAKAMKLPKDKAKLPKRSASWRR